MDDLGAADEAAAILMMSHAPSRSHISSLGAGSAHRHDRNAQLRPDEARKLHPAREAKSNAAAMKASRKKANAVRRKAAEQMSASKNLEQRNKLALDAASEAASVTKANPMMLQTEQPSQTVAGNAKQDSSTIQHEPIQSPSTLPSVQDAAALTLVKRLRMEAKERSKRKAMAAAAESEAIRIEMEQLDAIKARREAAEESKRVAAAAARADRAARRRAEVQARLTKLGGAPRRMGRVDGNSHHAQSEDQVVPSWSGGAKSTTEHQAPAARHKKWQWRPPAPVLPSGDSNAGSLAVAGMQVSGVSQALLAQAAAVDSAVPALQQRKASLAQLRANFDGASAGVSTPGSYYAPQYFAGGLESARSGGFPRGLGATSPATSRTGSPDMFQLSDAPLPQSSSPSSSATPRLRQGAMLQRKTPLLLPSRSTASSRGSARSTASARLSPLGDVAGSHAATAGAPHPAGSQQRPLGTAGSETTRFALGAAQDLHQTALAVEAALLDDDAASKRLSEMSGKAKLPAFSQVRTIHPLQSLPVPSLGLNKDDGRGHSHVRHASPRGGGGIDGWESKEEMGDLEDSFLSQHSQAPSATYNQGGKVSAADAFDDGAVESKLAEQVESPVARTGAAVVQPGTETTQKIDTTRPQIPESISDGVAHSAPDMRSKRLSRLQEMLPATPPGGISRRKTAAKESAAPKFTDLSESEVKHLADRMKGQAPVASGGARPGPGINRMYAAAAELADESDDEDITPDTVAKHLQQQTASAGVTDGLSSQQQAERALEIARNADFLKVLAGKKKKLASWNHAGEQPEAVEAFSGQGHSLSAVPDQTPSGTGAQSVASASVREARLAALARRGL